MRILFLTSAHNSLSQRLRIELEEHGHNVRVAVVSTPEAMIAAVAPEAPDLIVAPMLKIAVPKEIWSRHLCLIVHPGIEGDRGPSSLDWAITDDETSWGVTILEAAAEFDTGAVWASREFSMSAEATTKSGLYRGPVTEAAVAAVLEAVARVESNWQPEATAHGSTSLRGRLHPPMRQNDRSIDWMRDPTAVIARKIRAADSAPGVRGTIYGRTCFLYGAHDEDRISGPPGLVLAQRDGAICIGTIDGALWITHLKVKDDSDPRVIAPSIGCDVCDADICTIAGIKLPATKALGSLLFDVPELGVPIDAPNDYRTFRDIVYSEEDDVGYLTFDFYNGAMSTSQCERLQDAWLYARSRPTRAIVLLGGRDFWSNGIHLDVIEASAEPAVESWHNINAIDDVVRDILETTSHLVIAGMRGNAGAGGAMMALAADYVFARSGVVLNPHYRTMGGLYGSEYWTYTLPRRVGQQAAMELTSACQPIGTRKAQAIGFIDASFGDDRESFENELRLRAQRLAHDPELAAMLRKKRAARFYDERIKPLAQYRAEELAHMRANFFGPDPAYHSARRSFVFKRNPPMRESRPQMWADVQTMVGLAKVESA
jgi:putative two-component system hydrogenase maturation factor HypX/HoxX